MSKMRRTGLRVGVAAKTMRRNCLPSMIGRCQRIKSITKLAAVRVNLRVFVTGQIKEFSIERKIAWVENALAIWRPTEILGRSLVSRLLPHHKPTRSGSGARHGRRNDATVRAAPQ
jgi:hypothetical protein